MNFKIQSRTNTSKQTFNFRRTSTINIWSLFPDLSKLRRAGKTDKCNIVDALTQSISTKNIINKSNDDRLSINVAPKWDNGNFWYSIEIVNFGWLLQRYCIVDSKALNSKAWNWKSNFSWNWNYNFCLENWK